MNRIELLGMGCAKYFALQKLAYRFQKMSPNKTEVVEVNQPKAISERGFHSLPVLVFNGVVLSRGTSTSEKSLWKKMEELDGR